jgi:hypothetical protein
VVVGEAAEVEKTEAELDLSTLLANIFDAADEENELELRWEKNTNKTWGGNGVNHECRGILRKHICSRG